MRPFLLFWCLLISSLAAAQPGKLAGRVTDKKSGEAVIGATVLVTGTTQAAGADVEGNYSLPLEAGTYSITITYIGYQPLTLPGIVVRAGQTTTLNSSLAASATSLTEVTVTGVKQTGSEVALIQDLKKSEVVVSGVSSDQIVKTLDRDAAEVVRRIPGVTVQNNNFIVIRGLAERYNTVLLNDALTPSAEVDTRSFAFDILPSSAIDRVLIFKSGAPELPGEFGGGVVKVYTKNAVLDNSTSLTISGWARSTNTFKNGFLSTDHSPTDFLGFDSGQRRLPDALAALAPAQALDAAGLSALAQSSQYRNAPLPRVGMSRPDLRLSLGMNRKFEIGKVYVSNVTSISYSNTQEQYEAQRQRYNYDYAQQSLLPADQRAEPVLSRAYTDTRSLAASRLGIIHNYQVRLNDYNRLEFRNFFNQYGTDEVINRRVIDYEGLNGDGLELNNYSLHYQSRSIYSGQLGGSHDTGPQRRTTLTWAGGYNYVNRDEPDYWLNQQQRPLTPSQLGEANPTPYQVVLNKGVLNSDARYFSNLSEHTFMASGQAERRFSLRGTDTLRANQLKVRVGFYTEAKNRTFAARFFNYVPARDSRFDQAIREQSLATIFQPQNLSSPTGLTLYEGTNPQDQYMALNRLAAGYVSAVLPVGAYLNLSGGVRLEYNRKYLASPGQLNGAYLEERLFVLPSLNATYTLSERHLLRAGASISVNRPEFREIAEYSTYDATNDFFVTGDPTLQTGRLYNADLRYEFYPTRSELVSVGLFYKHFDRPIEQTTASVTGSGLYLSYQNADRAYDLGAELEMRKSFSFLADAPFWERLSLVLNASYIRSRVQLDASQARNQGFALTSRALQGQSPYVINAGLFYQDSDAKWQVSAQYNVVGPRITFVGDLYQNPSVIELPRHLVDLGITKGVGQHLEIRAGVQNLLNQAVRQYYDFDRNGEINGSENGKSFTSYRRGVYSTLGVTYRF